jgi:opacity protein-like surface antigen
LLSGWYLRGDLGYRLNNVGSVTGPNPVTSTAADRTISGTFGVGFKYQWFRADMTLDVAKPGQYQGFTGIGPQPEYMEKVRMKTGLVNAYFDMGTWSGFTPYVGVGAGMSLITSQTFVDDNQVGSRGKSHNMTWAAMAGVSYQVAPQWVVDVGYRYLSFGNLGRPEGSGAILIAPAFNNLTSQEVRLGVRFLFD